jgi:hypothetical protein
MYCRGIAAGGVLMSGQPAVFSPTSGNGKPQPAPPIASCDVLAPERRFASALAAAATRPIVSWHMYSRPSGGPARYSAARAVRAQCIPARAAVRQRSVPPERFVHRVLAPERCVPGRRYTSAPARGSSPSRPLSPPLPAPCASVRVCVAFAPGRWLKPTSQAPSGAPDARRPPRGGSVSHKASRADAAFAPVGVGSSRPARLLLSLSPSGDDANRLPQRACAGSSRTDFPSARAQGRPEPTSQARVRRVVPNRLPQRACAGSSRTDFPSARAQGRLARPSEDRG